MVDVGSGVAGRLSHLEVGEGQRVATGDVLGVLDDYAERRADVELQRARLAEARLRVRRAEELDTLEIQAMEANTRGLASRLAVSESDLDRLETLRVEQLVTDQAHERQRQQVRQAREELKEGETLLRRLRHRLVINREQAEVEVRKAEAQLAVAEARFERSTVRAPLDGTVLRIFKWPGETTGDGPMLRLGDTSRMYAVAEVYETDVRHVRPGQTARITSPALPAELTGTVERVGLLVHKNDVLGIDPTAETDARVVEVRILLETADVAARFIHLQVDVEIDVAGGNDSP